MNEKDAEDGHLNNQIGPKKENIVTLKIVTKTCDCENPSRTRARKVVMPPLTTAGPMVTKVVCARSSLVPGTIMK